MKDDSPSDVEHALEELFQVSPSEFVETRKRLAAKLHDAGDDEAARQVRERRKPTQMAWVLNTLARRDPDAVASLVDVGRELAREQRKALRGERSGAFRESIARQRSVVRSLAARAAKTMTELGVDPSGHLDEITTALQSALVDPAAGAALEEGRLERPPEAASGFAFGLSMPEAAEAPAKTSRPAARSKEATSALRARARREEQERTKLAAAKQRAEHAERQREKRALERALTRARARLRSSESAAQNATRAAQKAEAAARQAVEHAATLARESSDAQRRADEARETLARLRSSSADRRT